MEESVVVRLVGEFMRFGKVFGGKNGGIGGGKEGSSFVVGLVGSFSWGSGFPSGDCKRRITGFRES